MNPALLILLAAPFLLAAASPGELDFDSKVLSPASIAVRHNSLASITLPPGGVDLEMRCDVSRLTGRLSNCAPTAGDEPLGTGPARARMQGVTMDVGGLDPNDPTPLYTRTVVKLRPQERLSIYAPAAIDETAQPVWLARPQPADLADYYPERALEREMEGHVDAQCQIQADGSLICPGMQAAPVGTGFEAASVRLFSRYKAAPKLMDGRSSNGVWIQLTTYFLMQ